MIDKKDGIIIYYLIYICQKCYMLDKYKNIFAEQLKESWVDLPIEDIVSMIELPPANIWGDLWFPCFRLAKDLKKSPNQIAEEIYQKFVKIYDEDDFWIKSKKETIVMTEDWKQYFRNGQNLWPYINVQLSGDAIARNLLSQILSEKENYWKGGDKWQTILVESPGPNTNKPLHVWHVRNLLLWNSLTNVLRFAGYDTKRVDIINDRGIHICKSMLAYSKFGNNAEPNKKSDHYVWDWYVEYAKQVSTHPEMGEEIKDMLTKWEEGDQATRDLRAKMNKWAMDGMKETYKRYGAVIDKAYFEHEHYLSGKDIVLDAYDKGIFGKDNKWNIVYDTHDDSKWKKAVLRADGTSIYSTQDIGLAKIRYDDFQMDKMVYVVWNEQLEYFQVLFDIFKALWYSFAENCHHMSYGMISIPWGKMKSREWTVVDADNLADDIFAIAKEWVKERYPELSEQETDSRAEAIGMWAIKFFILKYDVNKNFVFNPEESLYFEWETGPYIQYTYARCCSVLRKAGDVEKDFDNLSLNTDSEKELLLHLSQFGDVVAKSAEEYKPHMIARYVLELSKIFNNYYHSHKVLDDDKNIQNSRVLLVKAVKQVLKNWLNILGIETPEVM